MICEVVESERGKLLSKWIALKYKVLTKKSIYESFFLSLAYMPFQFRYHFQWPDSILRL